jgi:hypothetical protein
VELKNKTPINPPKIKDKFGFLALAKQWRSLQSQWDISITILEVDQAIPRHCPFCSASLGKLKVSENGYLDSTHSSDSLKRQINILKAVLRCKKERAQFRKIEIQEFIA